jgi:hypothetical protein
MRVEDRGNSREEQKRVTETLKNLQQTDDTMREQLAAQDIPIDLHTCWYDDDGNVRCSEGW